MSKWKLLCAPLDLLSGFTANPIWRGGKKKPVLVSTDLVESLCVERLPSPDSQRPTATARTLIQPPPPLFFLCLCVVTGWPSDETITSC